MRAACARWSGAPRTLAVVSSGQGNIANDGRGGFEIHRASRAALNRLEIREGRRPEPDRRALYTEHHASYRMDDGS